MEKIGVLGSGTWGITLARMLANKGEDVTVWSAIPSEIDELSATGKHKNLPGMVLPESLKYTKEISVACAGTDVVVIAVPSVFVRTTARAAKPYLAAGQTVACVAKGLEPKTLLTMTEVIAEETGDDVKLVALSGPTHAEEVALDMPTMIVSASKDAKAAKKVQEIFSTDFMRVYTNPDIKGVELCGAIKNVMALAAGISAGLGYGDNAKAALITRGIAEMMRLGAAMGCNLQTFAGLAGIGDLVVTATSVHSRNNKAGFLIGSGKTAAEAVKEVGMVVEGLNALEGALELSRKYNVEMPIVSAIDEVVNGGADPREIVGKLMGRSKKDEF